MCIIDFFVYYYKNVNLFFFSTPQYFFKLSTPARDSFPPPPSFFYLGTFPLLWIYLEPSLTLTKLANISNDA